MLRDNQSTDLNELSGEGGDSSGDVCAKDAPGVLPNAASGLVSNAVFGAASGDGSDTAPEAVKAASGSGGAHTKGEAKNCLSNAQPHINGVATLEWNVRTGSVRYSDEWLTMTQNPDYDWTRPNHDQWWEKHVPPEDLRVIERSCIALLTGLTEQVDTSFRLLWPDGSWRWIASRSQVTQKTPDGAPLIVSGINMDITNVYSGEGQPKSSSSISDFDYHAMLENSPDLFVRFTRDFTPVYANPVITRYAGRGPESLGLPDTYESVRIPYGLRLRMRTALSRVFEEKKASRESLSFTMPNGDAFSGECSLWPEFDSEGAVRFAMVQFRDLTEKMRVEQQAKLSERRLEALHQLSLMDDASEDSVLDFVLESLLELTRSKSGFIFVPDEDGGESGRFLWSKDHYAFLRESYLPTDRVPNDILMQISGGSIKHARSSIRNGDGVTPIYVVFDGNMRVMRGIMAPGLRDGAVVCVAGVCNKESEYEEADLRQLETFVNSAGLILRRRKFVRELSEAKEAAESANKAKNAFLASVSHELRTPLNGVLGMLQLIETAPLAEEYKEYLAVARVSGKALIRIISDILDFSCMESGKMVLSIEPFDCKAAVRSALALFEDEARSKNLAFSYAIDPNIAPVLMGDEYRLGQIVFNIVGNALKYTQQGGVSVTCNALEGPLRGKNDKAGISLVVADTGPGIPPDKLESIFDAFTQVSPVNRGASSGTGLGLGIVRHLAAMMGGSVSVTSIEGEGSIFTCELLFGIPQVQSLPELPRRKESFVAEPMDILVAEDDSVGAFALRTFLERDGHRVVCVPDGEQALEALRAYPFQCLFTDITMPVMDGLTLARRIRSGDTEGIVPSSGIREKVAASLLSRSCKGEGEPARIDPDTTIVAVTAHTMIGDKERFIEAGMHYVIGKPVLREELREAVRFAASRLRKRKFTAL